MVKRKTRWEVENLLKDTDRVSAFFEAISDYSNNTDLAYDLGCGSGNWLSVFKKYDFISI